MAAGLLAALMLFGSGQAGLSQPPRADAGLAALPLHISTAARFNGTIVLFLSGDAGWDDFEQDLAGRLSRAGVDVIGLDSHRYFLEGRKPAELARDLDGLFALYRRRWHGRRLVLAGYSFGADALPFAWPLLSARTRRQTRLIALVGLQSQANFVISLMEMLDLPAADDTPVAPQLQRLPAARVICLYGRAEASACTAPELAGAERLARPGGHSRDGDGEGVAQAILRRLALTRPVRPPPHRAAGSRRG
ncbi:AcvB/VirJ family lysyl-phosphatidylglycerol hydrolase [Labrys neptuniae]